MPCLLQREKSLLLPPQKAEFRVDFYATTRPRQMFIGQTVFCNGWMNLIAGLKLLSQLGPKTHNSL